MIPPQQAQMALERLLASETFAKADRLSRFLRFVVERTLAGEAGELKEYRIGTEVFDRGADFDPRLDPIVRVEARRLRAKLAEYYEGPGRDEAVRIVLPKGAYAVVFEDAAGTAEGRPEFRLTTFHLTWKWVAVFALAVASGLAGVVALRPDAGPAPMPAPMVVAVLPFSDSQEQAYADALCEAISTELARVAQVRVVAWPRVVEYRKRQGGLSVEGASRDLHAGGVLSVSVLRGAEGDRRRITAILMNPAEGWKKWAGEFERGLGDDFAVQREVARAVADELRARLPVR